MTRKRKIGFEALGMLLLGAGMVAWDVTHLSAQVMGQTDVSFFSWIGMTGVIALFSSVLLFGRHIEMSRQHSEDLKILRDRTEVIATTYMPRTEIEDKFRELSRKIDRVLEKVSG